MSPLGKDPNRGGLPAAGGLIYLSEGGPEPTVSALDIESGKQIWQTELGPDFGEYAIGPTVAGGRVFVSTRANTRRGPKPENFRGGITALDAGTGEILWRRKNIYSWSPMASDGEALVCPMWSSPDEKIYLLNCRTGETIWAKSQVANHYNPPITFTRDLLLYQPWGPKLHALSRENGEEEWMFFNEFTSAGCCTPVVSGRYAYIGTSVPVRSGDLESLRGFRLADTPSSSGKYGTVNAIDLSNGKSVWRFPTANTVCGDPAIAYGKLYFASRDGRVYCCEPCDPGENDHSRSQGRFISRPGNRNRKINFREQPRSRGWRQLADARGELPSSRHQWSEIRFRPRTGMDIPDRGTNPDITRHRKRNCLCKFRVRQNCGG